MAQISYIKYTDVLEARRYDAEYFKPEYLKVEKKLKTLNYKKFGEILSKITGGATPLGADYAKTGVPFLRVQNIMQNYFDDDLVYITNEQDLELKRSRLKENDVLLTITGVSYGKSAVVEKRYNGSNINQHSVLMRFKDKSINPYYISTFLNCYYGKIQSDKNIVGLSRPALDYNRIKDYFIIPIFSQVFQIKIEQIIKSAHQKQTESKQLYHEAEELLLRELGLLDYQVKNKLTFSTTKKEIAKAHRYDSEYFQPKYTEIIKKIEKYEGGWDFVRDALNFKDKNYTPKANQKYKYLALSNISSQGYIQDYQEEFGKNLPSRARRKINTNDLIISSIEGSLSSCALIEEEFDNSICSTGFFVLNSQKINSETLLILFKSLVIQELLQRGSKGTILTAISKTELELIKIPLIKESIQNQIAKKIQESHRLRKESKSLLEDAKRKVEEEIEKQS
jgi:restriction endonuclease S subunit